MNKLLAATMIFLVGAGIAVFIYSRNPPAASPLSQTAISPTVKPTPTIALKTYADPSGFIFQYPANLILTPKSPLPSNAYAIVDLTSTASDAVINIKVEDSNLANVKDAVTATSSMILKLGDLTARQFTDRNIKTTVAMDQGNVLFTLTLDPADAGEPWDTAYNNIVSNFAFVRPTTSVSQDNTSTDTSSNGDIIYEGEEIIQ